MLFASSKSNWQTELQTQGNPIWWWMTLARLTICYFCFLYWKLVKPSWTERMEPKNWNTLGRCFSFSCFGVVFSGSMLVFRGVPPFLFEHVLLKLIRTSINDHKWPFCRHLPFANLPNRGGYCLYWSWYASDAKFTIRTLDILSVRFGNPHPKFYPSFSHLGRHAWNLLRWRCVKQVALAEGDKAKVEEATTVWISLRRMMGCFSWEISA